MRFDQLRDAASQLGLSLWYTVDASGKRPRLYQAGVTVDLNFQPLSDEKPARAMAHWLEGYGMGRGHDVRSVLYPKGVQ